MVENEFLAAACGHHARLRALVLCEEQPRSIKELAATVGLDPNAMGYHVDRLRKAGLLEAAEEHRRRGFVEVLWRTRAGQAQSGKRRTWADIERAIAAMRPGPPV